MPVQGKQVVLLALTAGALRGMRREQQSCSTVRNPDLSQKLLGAIKVLFCVSLTRTESALCKESETLHHPP